MAQYTPIAHWVGFHLFLVAFLAAELLYARRPSNRPPQRTPKSAYTTAVVATVVWISAALLVAAWIYRAMGHPAATEYLAGYAVEEALSVDNLFVFLLLFSELRIEEANRPRILFWGVLGAILMRGAFVAAGLQLLTHFEWISYIFGAVLLIAAIRLLLPKTAGDTQKPPVWISWLTRLHPVSLRQDSFFAIEDGRRTMTILFVALIAIELSDIVFALDSIPAVLSITRNSFLAYTSNIMAVMGLRSLFFLLAHLLTTLRFLHFGLGAVLAFAALKILSEPHIVIGPLLSLAVIGSILAITVGLSLLADRFADRRQIH